MSRVIEPPDDAPGGLPDDRSWSREMYAEAVRRKRAVHSCAACGSKRWSVGPELFVLPALDQQGRLVNGRGVEVVAVFCGACGLMRLHAANLLLAE